MPKPQTPEQINEQLAKTEERLKREGAAWEKRAQADPATYRRVANTPRELRVLFADLCACRLTLATSNRVTRVIANGFEPEEAMQALARVLVEAREETERARQWHFYAREVRVDPDTEKRVRTELRKLLQQLEAGQ